MPGGYGQYCPFSLAAELLCQRWTLLVVSRILDGCARFNEIQRGVPRMSPSLLSRRLRELEQAGIVRKRRARSGDAHEYVATEAGRDLQGIVAAMAVWGQHWARDMEIADLDPGFLVWSLHLRVDPSAMPEGRLVVEFDFTGAPANCTRFWLVQRDRQVEMCLKDPGLDVDLVVSSDLRLFVEAWRGIRDLRDEIRRGRIRLVGPTGLQQRFADWVRLGPLASHPRKRPGRERRLAQLRQSRGGQAPRRSKPRVPSEASASGSG